MPENVFVLGKEKEAAKEVEGEHERDRANEGVSRWQNHQQCKNQTGPEMG